ncbi:GNAT family N-acetyltransferase, partial [Candidatus Woesearchaeota archaeon]|nr:GNAT family N-acetyltransferase [Candidatus Woesearchaeota archaeon]
DQTVRDVEQIVELMSRAYTRDEEVIMWYEPTIGNIYNTLRDSVTTIARDQENNIVSISISEPAEGLRVEGEEIITYEVSDCATFPAHRSRGLLQACFEELLETPEMRQADIVFSESRIVHTPINRALMNYGFEFGGILRNHVYIGGDRDLPENNDIETLVALYRPGVE